MPKVNYPPGAIIEFLSSDSKWMNPIYDAANFLIQGPRSKGRHVEIVTGPNRMVGAVGGGVMSHLIEDAHHRKCRVLWPAKARRAQGVMAAMAAEKYVGDDYDTLNYVEWTGDIIKAWIKRPWRKVKHTELYEDNDKKWYCYELVDHTGWWQGAWNAAGIDITPGEVAIPQTFQAAINKGRLVVIDEW